MANVVNVKKLNKIKNNYPNIWEWMQHKASCEHMCIGAVLNEYEEYINELLDKEADKRMKEIKKERDEK